MIVKHFECAEHEEYGGLGWREIGKDHFQPLGGMAVAHDTLEHFPDDHGAIECELEALGAMIQIRGENYDRHEPWENLQSDMIDLYRLRSWEGMTFNAPTPAMERRSTFEFLEEQIDKLIKSLPDYLLDNHYSGEDEEKLVEAREHVASFTSRVAGWLRHGFRRCRKRYGTDHLNEMGWMFRRISDEAEAKLQLAERGVHKLKVSVCVKRREVKVVLEEPEYPEDDY